MASLEELRNERIKKLEILKEHGIDPYPINFSRDYEIGGILSDFSKFSKRKTPSFVVGRVMGKREHGGSVFADIYDGTGQIQVFLKKDTVGKDKFQLFIETIDVGDFISVKGKGFVTKRKEKSIQVSSWQIISKSLRPLPDKWHGLKDTEEKFRRRYVDMLMDPESKKRFLRRSKIIKEIRTFLDKDDFIEVETPILQPLAGGATAKPFGTHHNALDIDLYLRIAPELFLKKLLVGGFNKIYEIGRLFRNEGIDVTHNPEFTSIEVYTAYATPLDEQKRIEKLIKTVAGKVLGKKTFSYGENQISLAKAFKRMTYDAVLKKYVLINQKDMGDRNTIALKAKQLGVKVEDYESEEKILDNIYKKACRPKIIEPTFITDYPLHSAPLAKKKEGSEKIIDRFQLVIGGVELVNGFAELNDPLDQDERFNAQEELKRKGDEEAQSKDTEYIEAMEYGMPPATGWAIGIDRLAMLFVDSKNIRDVIIFPTLKPKQ